MKHAIRILIAASESTPSDPFAPSVQYYRTQGPCAQLPQDQFQITVKHTRDLLTSETWAWGWFDLLLVEKYWTRDGAGLIALAKQYGMKVWIDTDDDKQNIPSYNSASIKWTAHQRQIETNILLMADLLTVSTPALKKVYGGANGNIVVVRNAWNEQTMPPVVPVPAAKPVKMAWRGGGKHSGDLEDVRVPFAAAFNNQLMAWHFYGAQPPVWLNFEQRQFSEFMPLYAYFQRLTIDAPDWLFVPLKDNKFNHSKSDCSALEQNMRAGGGVIAPMSMPEFNRPGVIRYKDNAHLKDIFDQIAKGKIDKVKLAQEGQAYILKERTLSAANEVRAEAIRKLFE
jgi:hypothetical protein